MRFLKWLWSWFGGPPAPAPELISKAQSETVRLCGFLPAASTVGAIIGAMTGQGVAVATALGVATTICKAVSAKPLVLASLGGGDTKPVVIVNGEVIEIEGDYVV
jgi:hypothetical protein